jgi:hypothetical protein
MPAFSVQENGSLQASQVAGRVRTVLRDGCVQALLNVESSPVPLLGMGIREGEGSGLSVPGSGRVLPRIDFRSGIHREVAVVNRFGALIDKRYCQGRRW